MPDRPLLVYDGDCAFCRRWIARWRRLTGDRVDYEPYQRAAERFPEVPRERFAESVHLRAPDGRWSRGAAAALGALEGVPVAGLLPWAYRRVPGLAALAEACYRGVARNRGRW